MNVLPVRFVGEIFHQSLMTLWFLLCLALLPVAVSFAQVPMDSDMACPQCDQMTLLGQQGSSCGERDCTMPVCLTVAPALNVLFRMTTIERFDVILYDIHLPPSVRYLSPSSQPLHRPPIA